MKEKVSLNMLTFFGIGDATSLSNIRLCTIKKLLCFDCSRGYLLLPDRFH